MDEETVYRHDYEPQELIDQGLSPKFVEFVFLDDKPKPFRNWCEPREYGAPCEVPGDVTAVYPLWTCNMDVVALWLRDGQPEFVCLCHDNPDPQVLARTEQGLLAHLFRSLFEGGETLKSLRELAAVAGFRHVDELVKWSKKNGSAADYQERWQQFVASLN
jgi:hypothetical protein